MYQEREESLITCWMISTTIGSGRTLWGSSVWECLLLIWTMFASILRFQLHSGSVYVKSSIVVQRLLADGVVVSMQDKSGGAIIYRHINVLILYRGRNYDPNNRPVIPVMLWKPYPPIYPKLVKNVADGLTFEETKELRNRGLNSLPLMKLSKSFIWKRESYIKWISILEVSDCVLLFFFVYTEAMLTIHGSFLQLEMVCMSMLWTE